MKSFVTFLFGAIAGAVAVAFYTPVTGEELRRRVREKVQKLIDGDDEKVDRLVEMIASEIEKS